MSNDTQNNFLKQLSTFTENQIHIVYPYIGTITNVTKDRQYCDVNISDNTNEEAILSNVPAHGFPIIGDTAIIHFIQGKYEMPVAQCERSLPVPDDEITDYLQSKCFNYHNNGDFNNNKTGYTGNFNIIENETSTNTNTKACILTNTNDYIEFTVDLTKSNYPYFKFQAQYMGTGQLRIQCWDAQTQQIIKNLPYGTSYDYKIWESNLARNGWCYNKEVYPRVEQDKTTHNKIKIRITNITKPETIQLMPDTKRTLPVSMLLDALLVYDENGDTKYYNSPDDVTQ